MAAERVHLVRHGEVENPSGVVYGRMPGFHLSDRGQRQAQAAADLLRASGARVSLVVSSPLERTQESAAPIAAAFARQLQLDEDLIEASNRLEGKDYDVSLDILARPAAWRYLVNPFRPSWGEPYADVHARMLRAISRAIASVSGGDVVLVSHQMPIWVVSRAARGERLFHDPRKRECAHSSIVTFDVGDDGLVQSGYQDPGAGA